MGLISPNDTLRNGLSTNLLGASEQDQSNNNLTPQQSVVKKGTNLLGGALSPGGGLGKMILQNKIEGKLRDDFS